MPLNKRVSLYEYEAVSGLSRGQLWQLLSDFEKARLEELGYRYNRKLPNPALEYLMEIFPLPDYQTELVTLLEYERRCGFARYQLWGLLTEEQRKSLTDLGYRKYFRLPFRAINYLRSLGFY
jgi:hypothetical protein